MTSDVGHPDIRDSSSRGQAAGGRIIYSRDEYRRSGVSIPSGDGPEPSRRGGVRLHLSRRIQPRHPRRRVRRDHSGLAAIIAISFDLALGLVFGVVGLAWRIVRYAVTTGFKVVAEVSQFLGTHAWDFAVGFVRVTAACIEAILGVLNGLVDRLTAPRPHFKPAANEFREL